MPLYLKRIELHGFKSFADRVILEFQPGINAIVGPNGSGKSNIIDAIRWVLGEQSVKTLRGYKLEDVIFAGSNKKKPMGMAEVAITIDNFDNLIPLDYSEIYLVRRTFRSGESEFYLNRTPCRLKDIQEILVDSGVGKDGYSIISQGQIDEMLTCKAEERRTIFEETAGIVKYRIRKKEAEKRLEETMDNISRINDIITELLNQMEPLAVQKDVALKYKELAAAFKEIDINLLLFEVNSREKHIRYIKEKLEDKETLLTQLRNNIESSKKQISEYKIQQSATEEAYEKAQVEFYEINSKKKDIERDFQLVTAERNRIQQENEDLSNSIEKKKNELQAAEETLKLKSDELEEKIEAINELKLTINQNEKKLISVNDEINEKQRLIENAKGDVINLLNYVSEKKNVVSGLNSMKLTLEKRLNQIQNEELELDKANAITLKEVSNIKDEIIRLECLSKEYEQNIKNLKEILNQKIVEFDCGEKIKAQKQQDLAIILSKKNTLKEITDSYEGYQYGVKNLLLALKNQRYNDNGIYGTVADVISVKQQYEVAIETALGAAVQNIICENEESAKKAIEYLKKHDYGRVTFLPLSAIKPRIMEPNELNLLSTKGRASEAINFVKFDNKYYPVIAFLLGRVLVSNTLDDAIYIARRCNFSLKIVTIHGELLNPGGSITGGSQKRSNFLFLRKRQLIEFEQKIAQLEEQLSQIKQTNQELKNEIQDKQKMLEEKTNNLYSIKSKIAVFNQQLQEKQGILEERYQREKQLMEEKLHIEFETQEILSQVSSIETDIKNVDSQNISGQSKVKNLQKDIDKSKEIKEILSEKITKLKIKLASYNQEETSVIQSLQTIREGIAVYKDEIKKLKEKLEENNKTIISLGEKVSAYKESISVLTNKEHEYQELIESLRAKKEIIKTNINQVQANLNQLEKDYNQTEKTLQNSRIEEAKIVTELNQIKNQLYERYSITDYENLKIKDEFGSIDDMKKRLVSLKSEIEALGPINMQAIEDYDNLKTRYDFLKSQRDDLVKAKIDLDNLIKEITYTMEDMLLASIEKVNKEFNKVFFELFEGGSAQLIVEGEGSILECGVEVSAQPPGKKLQSISLLSGGERTLTAIALLFAILNTKATPFCVLDEIEAALDDANIVRFTRYLKKVSKHTQFIIITHRKPTMEIADALYGISMEDDAVSKVLAVKME